MKIKELQLHSIFYVNVQLQSTLIFQIFYRGLVKSLCERTNNDQRASSKIQRHIK